LRSFHMRDVLPELMSWWKTGESIGVGTVVATFRSAPRPPGASMLVCPDESAVGSVSGGCVEGAVYDLAQSVVESGEPVLQRYGVSDDDAFAVGLTCGGILDVYVEKVNRRTFPQLGEIAADIESGRPVALATVIEHPDPSWQGRRLVVRPAQMTTAEVHGSVGSPRADAAVRDDALGLLAAGTSATVTYGTDGERRGEGMRVFVRSFAPKPRLLVFGAIDFAAAVARVGAFLGYHVTVCDARPVFATTSRFPEADEVVVDWPHRYLTTERDAGRIDPRTVVTVLTHDPKFDVPLLEVALRMPEIAYVGAMGSRRTHDDRMERLGEAGLTEDELGRLSSPIGLDLGARTPEETAVSIAAEIIALRWGGTGRSLKDTPGRIHERPDPTLATLDAPLPVINHRSTTAPEAALVP
jgi:xanthine dehydrogenase accessory factor